MASQSTCMARPDGHKFRFTLRQLCVLVVSICVVISLLKALTDEARRSAISSASQGPLNQLQVALLCYHEVHGHFPPPYIADADGKPMHSWRVLILPFIEGRHLYDAYDFSEPWDGPNNRKLADKMPQGFHCPSEPESNSHTNYVVIVGPGTAFPGTRSISLDDFHDGPDNTILVSEISDSDIVWTDPRDLHVDTMSFRVNDDAAPSFSSSRRNGPYVVFADGITAYRIGRLEPTALRALTSIAGGEEVCMANMERVGLVNLCTGKATDGGLDRFNRWSSVRDIWLNRCRITDAGLAHLKQSDHLGKVHLSDTGLTDEGLRHLKGRRYLYRLNLSGTEVTDRGLRHLKGLTDMYYLDLSGTRISDAGLQDLQSLTSLRGLDLTNTKVTNNGVKLLKAALPSVEITH